MTALHETAYAKINLALHVRRKREDGYHALETVFAFAQDGDLLEASPAEELTLHVTGPQAAALTADAPHDNLVLRAARALREAAGIRGGALLRLDKRLPVASGIGGGSADAAAALRLLARTWELDADAADLHAIASRLGADVPACLGSHSIRGDGRGDALRPIDGSSWAGMPLLLVNPGTPLSTAAVFRAWDGADRGALTARDLNTIISDGRNDLQASALTVEPVIGDVLAALDACGGALLTRMSGSGATCFALFRNPGDRAAAARTLRRARPGWWVFETRLR